MGLARSVRERESATTLCFSRLFFFSFSPEFQMVALFLKRKIGPRRMSKFLFASSVLVKHRRSGYLVALPVLLYCPPR